MGRVNPDCVILITATPVSGFEPIEMGQKVAGAFGIDPSKLDRESWIANRQGFASLMRVLIHEVQAECCIILSGDVRYAFSTMAKFRSKNRGIQIKQLTSSAINNKPKQSKLLEKLGRIAEKKEHRFGWEKDPHLALRMTQPIVEVLVRFKLIKESEVFWTDVVQGVLPEGKSSLIHASNNVGWVKLRGGMARGTSAAVRNRWGYGYSFRCVGRHSGALARKGAPETEKVFFVLAEISRFDRSNTPVAGARAQRRRYTDNRFRLNTEFCRGTDGEGIFSRFPSLLPINRGFLEFFRSPP